MFHKILHTGFSLLINGSFIIYSISSLLEHLLCAKHLVELWKEKSATSSWPLLLLTGKLVMQSTEQAAVPGLPGKSTKGLEMSLNKFVEGLLLPASGQG